MRKITLLIAVLAVAAPSAAFAKHHGKKHHHRHHHRPMAAAPADPNANGRKLVHNGIMQIFVPIQSVTRR